MTLAAGVRLPGLHGDVTCTVVVFDFVARNAPSLHSRMNVVSTGMVSVALDAIRVLVHARRMRTRAPTTKETSDPDMNELSCAELI